MGLDRTKIVEQQFFEFLAKSEVGRGPEDSRRTLLSDQEWIQIFESQLVSRVLDLKARELKNQNIGYYTIGSSGHEGNVALGKTLRSTDPCFLHYRSGAMMAERSRHSSRDFLSDTLLSFCAAKNEPVSGGRHKVWGSRELWVPPQTSTIASHLPKALGMAVAIERAKKLKIATSIPEDSIVCCTFGDASCNHATAVTAFNSAQWMVFQKLPVPILFVCEDNGIGISVRTPQGWIEKKFSSLTGVRYIKANGLDLADAVRGATEAIAHCRDQRQPVFLHLKTVRLFGHAGSDVESTYLTLEEIEAQEKQDPILHSARFLISQGIVAPDEISAMYSRIASAVEDKAKKAVQSLKISTAPQVTESLFQTRSEQILKNLAETIPNSTRKDLFSKLGQGLPEDEKKPRHMAWLINAGLKDLLLKYPQMILFGEDVAKKGGVYHVTADLTNLFGVSRVFNTLLDETTILGLAIGSAQLGLLPVPEIQYLAYYHNAEDQIRGEAASQSFFSNGQFQNPMVVRIASFAYQKGFGGHFHNDHSIAALLDVPGVMIAAPSRGDEAVKMMRTCVAHAKEEGRVVLFLEPIALYMKKDLFAPGDGLWQFAYPSPEQYTPSHEGGVYYTKNRDILIVTYANGVSMALQAAKILEEKHKIRAKIYDLRWLKPLPMEHLEQEARGIKKILVVDECRKFGGIGEKLVFDLYRRLNDREVRFDIVQAVDTYLPLGPAADLVLPSVLDIVQKAVNL